LNEAKDSMVDSLIIV